MPISAVFADLLEAIYGDENLAVDVEFAPGPANPAAAAAAGIRVRHRTGEEEGRILAGDIAGEARVLRVRAADLPAIEEGDRFTIDGKTYPVTSARRLPPREAEWELTLGAEDEP